MLLLVCLAVYLVAVGLDKADKVASVIGVFVGLIGLGFGIVGLVRGRGDPNAPSCGVTSTVTGMVSGTVIQAGTINGDVDGRRRG